MPPSGHVDFEGIALEIERMLDEGACIDEEALYREYPAFEREIRELLSMERLLRPVRSSSELDGRIVAGAYRLVREIGRGGMGRVFEAEQLRLHRRVAVKILDKIRLQSTRRLDRFRREAAATAVLSHPGIVPIHDFGIDEDLDAAYLAMDLIEGVTLSTVVRRLSAAKIRSLDWDELLRAAELSTENAHEKQRDPYRLIVRWIAEAADALGAAHSIGLIHRDVKPENILLRRDGAILVADFGLARIRGDLGVTQTGDRLGSPGYMSPEQVSGKAHDLDHRTDIFSLGVTLYELLTLRRPFGGGTTEAVIHQIVTVDPTPPRRIDPRVPRDLETIALKMLEKEPRRRYGSAEALATDLRRFVEGFPISARPIGPLGKASRFARRNRPFATLGVVTVLMLLAAGFWFLRSREARARDIESAKQNAIEAIDDRRWSAAGEAMAQVDTLERSDWWVREQARRLANYMGLKLDEYHERRTKNAALREQIAHNRSRYERGESFEGGWQDLLENEEKLFEREREQADLYEDANAAYLLAVTYLREDQDLQTMRERAFYERWLDFESRGDQAGMQRMSEALENEFPASQYLRKIRLPASLKIRTDPPGAEVYVFRYEDERTVAGEAGLPRLVPVPCASNGGWSPDCDHRIDGVRPGEITLVVESVEPGSAADSAGLEPGDLIARLNGIPISSLFYAGFVRDAEQWSYSRIRAVDGKPFQELTVWGNAFRRDREGPVDVTLERRNGETTVRSGSRDELWRSLGIGAFPWNAEQFLHRARNGAVTVGVIRGSESFSRELSLESGCGLRVWTTSCPLLFGPHCRVEPWGRRGGEIAEIPSGSYLLLLRAQGYEDLRYPVLMDRGEPFPVTTALNPSGTTPPGFVFIPKFRAIVGGDPMATRAFEADRAAEIGPLMVKRDEVSFADYLSFLNDPPGRRLIERAAADGEWGDAWPYPTTQDEIEGLANLAPDALGKSRVLIKVEPSGQIVTRLRPELEVAVRGVQRDYSELYATFVDETDSSPHHVRLPTEREWEAVARGADGRKFPWGDTFCWELFHGWHSIELTGHPSLPTSFPADESPFGVRSLAGGTVVEWCLDEPGGETAVRGGNFERDDPRHFRAASRVYKGPGKVYDGAMGIRLVLEPDSRSRRR